MTKIEHYALRFVQSFPTPMEAGVLYVSTTYSTAGHMCPCGCEREVVTKLSPARWSVMFDGEVSLRPSVASTGLPCNSHYFITRGDVDWRYQLNANHAARAQAADRRAAEYHRASATVPAKHHNWWARIWSRSD